MKIKSETFSQPLVVYTLMLIVIVNTPPLRLSYCSKRIESHMMYTWQLIPLVKDWWVILLGAVTELGKCHYGWGSEWKVYVTENEGVKGVDAISGIFSSFCCNFFYNFSFYFFSLNLFYAFIKIYLPLRFSESIPFCVWHVTSFGSINIKVINERWAKMFLILFSLISCY